jgi:hypothetical protein
MYIYVYTYIYIYMYIYTYIYIGIDSCDNTANVYKNKNTTNDKDNENYDINMQKTILEQIEIYRVIMVTIKGMNFNLLNIAFDDLKILGNSCLLNSTVRDFITPLIKISKLFMDDKTQISQR